MLIEASPNLKFTLEKASDFSDNWMPTLDFNIGVDYKKNMCTLAL